MMTNPVVQVKNLSKHYTGFDLQSISFSLEKGCITGLIGPNGAGKSTTILAMLGLISPDSGSIDLFGQSLNPRGKNLIEIRQRIGVVLDEGHFYEFLTLKQMKDIMAPFYKNWDEMAFRSYIRRFQLPLDKKIADLSKGMRMKYAITIALSHQADLLIMDEPTSGLDPLVRDELLDILHELLQDENKSVLFSTHITSDLEKVADYILLINQGQILFYQEKDKLLEQHVLVKGARNQLSEPVRSLFIGLHESDFGFEGMICQEQADRKQFGDGILFEKPTLEQIML